MQPVPEQAPVPVDNVQILGWAAAVCPAAAGLPPGQQRRCYAVCACASARCYSKILHRGALVRSSCFSTGRPAPIPRHLSTGP